MQVFFSCNGKLLPVDTSTNKMGTNYTQSRGKTSQLLVVSLSSPVVCVYTLLFTYMILEPSSAMFSKSAGEALWYPRSAEVHAHCQWQTMTV